MIDLEDVFFTNKLYSDITKPLDGIFLFWNKSYEKIKKVVL